VLVAVTPVMKPASNGGRVQRTVPVCMGIRLHSVHYIKTAIQFTEQLILQAGRPRDQGSSKERDKNFLFSM
jgi:hypothetical protein